MNCKEGENEITGVTVMEPCVKLPLPQSILMPLYTDARDYALLHGVGMRPKALFSEDSISVAPFTLLPSTFPRSEFERARDIQTTLNELMFKVAHDHDFLESALKNTIKVDPFTARLYEIYETVRKEGVAQELSLGLFRSDYMMTVGGRKKEESESRPVSTRGDSVNRGIFQVEFNTIAVSFGPLSSVLSKTHRYVLASLGEFDKLSHLPENPSLQELNAGMVMAWELYGNKKAIILFLVEEVTYNIADQRFMQFEVQKQNPSIRVVRCTLPEVASQATLGPDRQLLMNDLEVAVVYFRTGYVPDLYTGEKDWEARLLIERSRAIKCPSIHFHLAGTKKVQQVLGKRKVLERYLSDPAVVGRVKDMFTGLYSLDLDDEGEVSAVLGKSHPSGFVLKPQREGGGNNIYGQEVADFLEKLGKSPERSAYILMDRICPPSQLNYIVRPNQADVPEPAEVVSELGIYGVIVGSAGKILRNKVAGHVLRTKLVSANEGGVSGGAGALDSPFLVDF